MAKASLTSLMLTVLATTLALGACSNTADHASLPQSASAGAVAAPSPSPAATLKPKAVPSPPAPTEDFYNQALDKAASARSISQSALSPEDWDLAANRWQQAVNLLKKVPVSSPDHNKAKSLLGTYQQSLADAKKRKSSKDAPGGSSGITIDPVLDPDKVAQGAAKVHRLKILYRRSNIPVVNVSFNGKRQFPMMVDTGASGTMITQRMRSVLQANIVGEIPIMTPKGASIAPVAMMKSIQAGGRTIRDVPVTIGPMDIGLLGHDYFGDCDLVFGREYVELHNCGL